MGNPILKELKAIKKACDDMLESDRQTFKDNELFMNMAEKACYKAFYQTVAMIIKDYEVREEQEAAEYENYLYGGKDNEV